MFLLTSALLSLVVLAWVVYPLLREQTDRSPDQAAANAQLLKSQLQELDEDRQQGLLSQQQYDTARLDLQQAFLESVREGDTGPGRGSRSPLVALVLIIAIPLFSYLIYDQVGTHPDSIQYMTDQRANSQANPHAAAMGEVDINAMVERVRQRAQADPGDLDSWRMLARSLRIMQDYEGAAAAYRHLIDQGVEEAEIYSNYADLTASLAGGIRLDSEAYPWVLKALALEPDHPQSLWIAGTAAYYSENYPLAREYWQRLLALLEPGSDTHRAIEQNLRQLEEAAR